MTLNIREIVEIDKSDDFCEHLNTEYQPEEDDTNASESLICLDCGEDFAHKDIKKGANE